MFFKNYFISRFFSGLLLLASLLVLSNCGDTVVIKGKVFIEDELVMPAWKNDPWVDYTENAGGVIIRSGNAEAKTDGDGYFELEGLASGGALLLEFSKSGYQTAYVEVDFSVDLDGDNVIKEKGSAPRDRITWKKGSGTIRFYDTRGGGGSRRETIFSAGGEAYHVSVYLLKEPDSEGNWTNFKYRY